MREYLDAREIYTAYGIANYSLYYKLMTVPNFGQQVIFHFTS